MSERGPLEAWSSRAISEACLGLHVRRAARAISRRYEEFLRPVDLTLGQFSILAALHRPTPISMSRLSEGLGMDRTTLTANLRPLERRGLVSVSPNDQDRRRRDVTLTDEGRRVLAAALPLWEEAQQATIDGLSGSVAALKRALLELS